MNIVSTKKRPDGRLRVTLDIAPTEMLLQLGDDEFYRLGYPLDDMVLQTHHLAQATRVYWDAVEQKFVESDNSAAQILFDIEDDPNAS